MAKRERNKRAARKARQQERARKEAAQAAAAPAEEEKSRSLFKGKSGKDSKSAPKTIAKADRKGISVVTGYFSDVRAEMRKVTWPSANELRSYSVAVIATLIVLGIVLWLVDTAFVAGLVQYTSLRG